MSANIYCYSLLNTVSVRMGAVMPSTVYKVFKSSANCITVNFWIIRASFIKC